MPDPEVQSKFFSVRKTSDDEVVVRFPEGYGKNVGKDVTADQLVLLMLQFKPEPVVGRCICGTDHGCCVGQ